MALGLYELVGGATNGDLTSRQILACIHPAMPPDIQKRISVWAKEFRFWESYAEIYWHIEDTGFYAELAKAIRRFINPKRDEVWLDAGCGPAKMAQLAWEKSGKTLKKIYGIDIVLKPARETLVKLGNSIPLELKYANLGERLPFPDNFFNGIVAGLSLTYVIDFEGKRGKDAFTEAMREMHRVLKPGGHIVWSTPKRNPFFWKNFLVALPDMLSPRKQIRHRVFGPWIGAKILRYGLGITSKGRSGVYTFLDPKEYEKILKEVGFRNFKWQKSFAGQVWVNKAEKPEGC